MSACDAELCPYWGGDKCLCDAFGIDKPGPDVDPAALPSATYVRTSPVPSGAGDQAAKEGGS